jgi:CHAD domain-containing protein
VNVDAEMGQVPTDVSLCAFLRHACERELKRALDLLSDASGDRNEAVHESRKCVRRVRAWLRLGDPWRRRTLAEVDAKLRTLRRTLGPLRDAASRIEALDRLRQSRGIGQMGRALTQARSRLTDNLERRWARRPAHGRTWQRLLQGLRELLDDCATWPFEGLTEAELRRAVKRAFRRACRGRRENLGRHAAAQRHSWRGCARILLLQCQLLEERKLLLPAGALKRLAQSLGDENDLALVSRVLGQLGLPERTRMALRAHVQAQRRALAKRNDVRAAKLLRSHLAPRFRTVSAD